MEPYGGSGHKQITISHDGRAYTVDQLVRMTGKHKTTIYRQIQKGCTFEEITAIRSKAKAINVIKDRPKRNHGGGRPPVTISHNGRIYTVAELAELTGLSRNTIIHRIKKGWSYADVIRVPSKTPNQDGPCDGCRYWLKLSQVSPYYACHKLLYTGQCRAHLENGKVCYPPKSECYVAKGQGNDLAHENQRKWTRGEFT